MIRVGTEMRPSIFPRVDGQIVDKWQLAALFGESLDPVMAAIEGLPSVWDARVTVEVDYFFGR